MTVRTRDGRVYTFAADMMSYTVDGATHTLRYEPSAVEVGFRMILVLDTPAHDMVVTHPVEEISRAGLAIVA